MKHLIDSVIVALLSMVLWVVSNPRRATAVAVMSMIVIGLALSFAVWPAEEAFASLASSGGP